MESLWFVLLAAMLGVYVALDGFDFGVGALHLLIAKTPAERAQVLRSIGPVWDGNEVWLVAAGGTLFAAFPGLYALAFSGFYLPLMAILWLLVFRALAIELRHQMHEPLWEQFWDVAFALSSLLLIVFFGAAIANVVRGVTYGPNGDFFTPLWTSFSVSAPVGILDWYTTSVAAVAVVALASHGALWLAHRTDGAVQQRAADLCQRLPAIALMGLVVITIETVVVQPRFGANLWAFPPGLLAGAVGVGGLAAVVPLARSQRWSWAFWVSSAGLCAMTIASGTAVYPAALPSVGAIAGPRLSDVAADSATLSKMLLWWVPGMALASTYTVLMYRRLPGGAAEPTKP